MTATNQQHGAATNQNLHQQASTTLGGNALSAAQSYNAAIPEPRRPSNSAVAAPVVRPMGKYRPPRPINQVLNLQPVAGSGATATQPLPSRSGGERAQPAGARSRTSTYAASARSFQRHHVQPSDVQPTNGQNKNFFIYNGRKYTTLCQEVQGNKIHTKHHLWPSAAGGDCLQCGFPSFMLTRCRCNPNWEPGEEPAKEGGAKRIISGHSFRVSRNTEGNDVVTFPYCINTDENGVRCGADFWAFFNHECKSEEAVEADSAPASPLRREGAFVGRAEAYTEESDQ